MKDLEEQRVSIQFCLKFGKMFTETFQMFIQGIRNLTNCFNVKFHPLSSGGLSVKIDHYHAIY